MEQRMPVYKSKPLVSF